MNYIPKNAHYCISLFIIIFCCCTAIGAENNYSHGHSALEIFDGDGFKSSPFWVQLWVGFMLSTFAVGLLFAWKHSLARWAIGGLLASMSTGQFTFGLLELPFLGGSIAIMHILCWTPALILLLIKQPFLNPKEALGFRIWSGIMTAVIIFSFIFDIKDAAIYINHVDSLS